MDYRVEFDLASPIVFFERPALDSIIAYAYLSEKYNGMGFTKLSYTKEDLKEIADLPINKKDGYYLASLMFFDNSEMLYGLSSKKKRWDSKYDYLADFGKRNRQVNTKRGENKSYDIPFECKFISNVWFYLNTSEIEHVKYLILKHIAGIGKNVKIGYGIIKSFRAVELNTDNIFDKHLLRPIPSKKDLTPSQLQEGFLLQNSGWYPPYWLDINKDLCYYPKCEVDCENRK
jgi:CRISPR type IV-associated protein Csf3